MGRKHGAVGRQYRESVQAAAKGYCVFHALHAGLRDMQEYEHIRTYANMLGSIRNKLRNDGLALQQVSWCGEELSAQDINDFSQAVLLHVHVKDGYWCSACDPLLASYCAAFRLNVVHDFAGTETTYEVPSARRIVHLSSSLGHMEHMNNQDVDMSTSEVPEGAPHAIGDVRNRQSWQKLSKRERRARERAANCHEFSCDASKSDELVQAESGLVQATSSASMAQCGSSSETIERWAFSEVQDGSLYGRPVLVETANGSPTVGILRRAQGKSQGKIVTPDGHVRFFAGQDAWITAFSMEPCDASGVEAQMAALTRVRLSLLASKGHRSECFPLISRLLEPNDLLAASRSSLAWLGMCRTSFEANLACKCDSRY
eukprot:TRINITY_DN54146_c0_g1_i1.p1 TRINITY_DN54146_c0_g1~~TRINITY_DN54146_c0_g1_i1.p1  ORF type:complete len:373 (-),score=32.74 TRINITY_DN54146_c0_g1_i1:161-1279(-)